MQERDGYIIDSLYNPVLYILEFNLEILVFEGIQHIHQDNFFYLTFMSIPNLRDTSFKRFLFYVKLNFLKGPLVVRLTYDKVLVKLHHSTPKTVEINGANCCRDIINWFRGVFSYTIMHTHP